MVQGLVLQLDKYFDPFLIGFGRHMKTGVEIDHSIVSGLLSSMEAGEKQFKDFVDLRLKTTGEDRMNLFDKLVNLKIRTGQEKAKKDSKAVNVLKEDRQAFGVLVGKATTPEEAHSHPLTTVPLALATQERDLRQGSKATLRNYLIDECTSIIEEPPNRGNWLIDGMAAVKSIPSQMTWGEYADILLKFCLPPRQSKPLRIGIIFDSYSIATRKQLTQRRRGVSDRITHITSPEQSMPKGKDWDSFLQNAENKTELIRFLVHYFKTDSVRSKLKIPLTVREEENTWLITQTNIEKLESCNHDEADTRLVLHASQSTGPVIIRATDTNVVILLSYAYSVCKPLQDWLMKIDHRYVSVNKLTTHFGDEVCEVLPAYHSIAGCDTTSFPFRIGKIKPIKKMIKQEKFRLLSKLGRSAHSVQDVTSAKCFFRTCMYSGSDQESFVETRIRMYNIQKVKSSSSILPDESSTNEHLKRSDLQTMVWRQCLKQNIQYPSITDRGWKETDDGIRPIWFTCPQLPPSISMEKGRKIQKQSK